jgi:hypothetical protein
MTCSRRATRVAPTCRRYVVFCFSVSFRRSTLTARPDSALLRTMFSGRFLSRCGTVAAWAVMAGCTSSPMSRIDANRAEFETWPMEMQQAVIDGFIKKGMTPKMVEMAIGRPAKVIERSSSQRSEEIWVYHVGGSIMPERAAFVVGVPGVAGAGVAVGPPSRPALGVPTTPGTVNVGGGVAVGTPPEKYTVVFEEGVVVKSDYPLPKT